MYSYYIIVIEELGDLDLAVYSPLLIRLALDFGFFDGFDSNLKDKSKIKIEEHMDKNLNE